MSGALKNDQEKSDFSLVPAVFLDAVARAFMVGEKKYGRYNYYKGHKTSQLIAAAMRHLTAFMEGEENDPIDGQPHLGSVGACVAMLLQQQKLGTLQDNRNKSSNTEIPITSMSRSITLDGPGPHIIGTFTPEDKK